jgi:uncharacterized protein with HEPN domain
MKQRDTKAYLYDIGQACKRIKRFVANRTYDQYCSDEMLRSAVERQFEIIGEALSKLVAIDDSYLNRISDCRKIIAFRNRLIHGYGFIADKVVWGVIENGLPGLHKEVEEILKSCF